MPLSIQTWAQSALGTPAGSGDTAEEVLAAIKLLIDADSNWTASSDGTGSSPAYLEITSANDFGATNQKFKLLLVEGYTVNAAWALGGSGNWAAAGLLDHTAQVAGTLTNGTDDLYVGYVAPPSNGTSSTAAITTGNIFNATGPYGGTAASDLSRFSSYVKFVDDVSNTTDNRNISKVWLMSCQEMLTIALEDVTGRVKFVHAGAIIAPLSDLAGETISSGVGRVYGMCTAKADAGMDPDPADPDDMLWSGISSAAADTATPVGGGFTPEIATGTNTKAINSCMIIHYPESNALDCAHNIWTNLMTLGGNSASLQSSGIQPGCLMDTAGNIAAMPIPIVDGTTKAANSPLRSRQLIGVMRQVKLANPSVCRSTVQDAAGTVIGFTFTGSRIEAAQGFLYTNS
jgi:hypothetical protein